MNNNIFYTIQSANRVFAVPVMEKAICDVEHTWFVPTHNVGEYKAAGAKNVIGVDGELPMKSKQLNAALGCGFSKNMFVMTMDDDYISSSVLDIQNGKKKSSNISLSDVILALYRSLINSPYHVAGVPSNTNPFYANDSCSKKGMVSGQFILHKPPLAGPHAKFDEGMKSLEDFDYIINHHFMYGGLLKLNKFMVNFHMINRGTFLGQNGVGGYDSIIRTEDRMLSAIEYIKKKWNDPNLIIDYNGFGKSIHKKVKWTKLNRNNGIMKFYV